MILNIVIPFLGLCLVIFLGPRLLRFFMPFVVLYFFSAKGSLCDYYLITVPLCFAFRFFSTPSIWLASSNDIVYRSIFDYL